MVKNDYKWSFLSEAEFVNACREAYFSSGSIRSYWLDAAGTRVHVFGYKASHKQLVLYIDVASRS